MISKGDSRGSAPAALPPRPVDQGVVGEVYNNDHLLIYDKESGEGYKSVPLRPQNSDASQDALKLVPDSSL